METVFTPAAADSRVQQTPDTEQAEPTVVQKNRKQRRALAWCIGITFATMIVEFVASVITGSLMLYSDALHMFSHAASLGISLIAAEIALRKVGRKFPFGLRKVETVAAFVNGLGLIGFTVYIVFVSGERLMNPAEISSRETIAVAIVGLLVNLLTALILSRAGLENLNTRSAFLHMLADTFSSVAIIGGGVLIYYTDWYVIDPLLSLVVAAVVGKWAFGLIRDSFFLLLNATPSAVNYTELEDALRFQFPAIASIDSLKVWEEGTEYRIASLKLTTNTQSLNPETVSAYLAAEHQIAESTVQVQCA